MKITTLLKALLPVALLACASATQANQIVLEGSDATSLHHDSLYSQQIIDFMRASAPDPSKPVLILGTATYGSGSIAHTFAAGSYSLTGLNLANYSGVYVQSPGGCCTQNPATISAGDKALIAAAELAGLSLTLENYGGGPGWGVMLPTAVNALAASNFGGITDYGSAGGPTCTDREVFNATGLAFGFVQPPVLSCYEHQGYRTSAFTPLGFVSLVNADPTYSFGADGSALLAFGGVLGTPPSGVPEPETVALLGLGILGLVAARRRKAK